MEAKKEQTKEQILADLEECRKQADEYLQGWQRERADAQNVKKEMREYAEALAQHTRESLFEELFSVLDNLDRAESALNEKEKQTSVTQGFLYIARQLRDVLARHGVREIPTEKCQMFDPAIHEAVQEVEEEGMDPGTILEVLEKGYTREGKLLRPAKVTVVK
ncbi:MAG: nucleotide exchange factor GrpE [Candidatus Yanofskybacteria bacterium]|nr:nucleotide exchange factor GrpE [Candidatus Yanofskybacteria bacterium]